MVDLSPYRAQIEEAWKQVDVKVSIENPRQSFLNLLSSHGFFPPRSLVIGAIDRIDGAEDKRGRQSGWYIYHEDEQDGRIIAFANYGDFKRGFSDFWSSKAIHTMNDYERSKFHEAQVIMKAKHDAETKRLNDETARIVTEKWNTYQNATDNHPYLVKKQVKTTTGIRVDQYNNLFIPAAVDGAIVTAQRIKAEGNFIINGKEIGNKKFEYGGKSKGAWFLIQGDSTIIYIAEGYATGKSINEATGATVYICFQASNIYEVTEYAKNNNPKSHIIIAGDDDVNNVNNVGRQKAEQAANGLGVDVIFPPSGGDFNDYHVAHGLPALKALLKPEIQQVVEIKKEIASADSNEFIRPSGVMGCIYDYYNATSGVKQQGFAIQTALAVCSIVLARSYTTDLENYSTLYLLSVGETGTGKEHHKTIAYKILAEADQRELRGGRGYTSDGAVSSALIDKPKHLTIIDEFARYLDACKATSNSMQKEANTLLMEAFTCCHSELAQKVYSGMSGQKKDGTVKAVFNPAITLLAMTTPENLYQTLDMNAIKDGFVNRFLIYESFVQMQKRTILRPLPVPDSIIDWAKCAKDRYGKNHVAGQPSEAIVLYFTDDALEKRSDFEDFCIEQAKDLKKFGMSGLTQRSVEIAMRVSLICALSDNPYAATIEERHMNWAIWWVKRCLTQTMARLKISISGSEFESHKKAILADLRARGDDGITWSAMQKNAPYSLHKQRDLKEILTALKDADLAIDEFLTTGKGRPAQKWTALK